MSELLRVLESLSLVAQSFPSILWSSLVDPISMSLTRSPWSLELCVSARHTVTLSKFDNWCPIEGSILAVEELVGLDWARRPQGYLSRVEYSPLALMS
jgi:hypothetical protein